MEISRKEKQLSVQVTGQSSVELVPLSSNKFKTKGIEAELTFETGKEGKVTGLMLRQNGQKLRWKRTKAFEAKSIELKDFVGDYYSPELSTTYSFEIEDGKLKVRHARHGQFDVKVVGEDRFITTRLLGQIEFMRDKDKRVVGCKMSNGRVRNLRFTKEEM